MAKKKNNWFKNIFGRRFNFWDVIVIGILTFYMYGLYVDLNTGIWRVFREFAGVIFFAYIVTYVVAYIKKRSKK